MPLEYASRRSQAAPRQAGQQAVPATGISRQRTEIRRILTAPRLQAKLVVGPSDDAFEREADQVADRVMRMPAPGPGDSGGGEGGGLPPRVQRACSCGGACPSCRQNDESLQRSPAAADSPETAPPEVHDVLRSSGQPLDASARSFLEPRMGHDLSGVRIHAGPAAAQSAKSVNALAYTVGRDIVFGEGQYAPGTASGRHLLAHEVTHVAQQGGVLRRQTAPATPPAPSPPAPAPAAPAAPAAPTFGPSCTRGATDPCQASRCSTTQVTTLQADLTRALGYVNQAITALNASPLASSTTRALDWYFRDHQQSTVDTVRTRLGCIRDALTDTQNNQRYGCHPDHSAFAYVCLGSTPICTDAIRKVCVTDRHFNTSPRDRAETLIHECAHRVGMSLGGRTSVGDLYSSDARFLSLGTDEALRNSDSFSLFAGSIAEGVRLTVLPFLSLAGGVALPTAGGALWQASLYGGAEFQHPVLSIVNPTIGLRVTMIGAPAATATSPSPSPSLLTSIVPGIRIGQPRTGSAGGGYASFYGGPGISLPLRPGGGSDIRIGAEAGMAVGYRWRFLDFSAGGGYAYHPSQGPGREHLFMMGTSITFLLGGEHNP